MDICGFDIDRFSRFFKAVSDPTRQRIMKLLAGGGQPVGDISERLEISQPTASRHLGILKNAGLVEDIRAGKQVIYKLLFEKVDSCCVSFCLCLDSSKGKKKAVRGPSGRKASRSASGVKRVKKGGNK